MPDRRLYSPQRHRAHRDVVRFLVLALIVVAANAVANDWRGVDGIPPTCIPLPALPISYSGSVSGCTSQSGGKPVCIAGENIQFKYGDGVNACCPAGYMWQFDAAPINNGASGTITHQFPVAGTYVVSATVTACSPVTVTQVVPVASASVIPALNPIPTILLILVMATLAWYRLR